MVYPGAFVEEFRDKPAVVMARSGVSLTYGELEDRSVQLARVLQQRGLGPGDKIAMLAENHPHYYEVFWAAFRSGLYFTPVNRHSSPAEAAYIVNDSGSCALVTTNAMSRVASAVLDMIPDCRTRLMMDGAVDGFESYEDALAAQPTDPLPDQPRGSLMGYSSGTTGRPKGIVGRLPGKSVDDPDTAMASRLAVYLLGMTRDSVYLCPAPLYHAAPLMWTAGMHEIGATAVIMENFDAVEFLEVIERERVTHVQVVPTMLVRLLKLPAEQRLGYDVGSLQGLVHAAAPCPIEVKRQIIDWLGPIVHEYYGASEGIGFTYIAASDWLAHPGSVGRTISGTIHICDDEGNELPTGGAGTIYFEQPAAGFEYHGDPAKTRSSRHPQHDNWSTVGDVGYLDDEGYLYLTDRKAFTIISGGVNIYPAEIESRLVMHPTVADVAVFGLPDAEMGEYVHAVVQLVDGAVASPELAEELRAYAREYLSGYKVPRSIDFRSELPRLPTGKLQKGALRDEYVQATRKGVQ
jgi:long-chain acyl-CoA synthetase